jgi:putative protease
LKEIKRACTEGLRQKLLYSYRRMTPAKMKMLRKISSDFRKKIKPVTSVIVRNNAQLKAATEARIEKIYRVKNNAIGIALEKHMEKFDVQNRIVYNLYELIHNKNDQITLHWTFNIANRTALESYQSYFPKIGTMIISPELSFDSIQKIGMTQTKKAVLIYSKLRAMTIELDIFQKMDATVINEQRDIFVRARNDFHNTELYFEKPLNILNDKHLQYLDVDEYVLEFFNETYDEVKVILSQLQGHNERPYYYNYLRGVF